MSTSMNASIIYGFPCPPNYLDLLGKDEKGRQVYLWQWIDTHGLDPAEHLNAGKTNFGNPEQMVGVVLHKIEDFTRDVGYEPIPATHTVSKIARERIARAAALMGVEDDKIGFYLVGEAA